jgi:hypothetical protein
MVKSKKTKGGSMNKHVFKFLALSVVAILIAVIGAGCGSSSSSSSGLSAAQVAELTSTGTNALTSGSPTDAKAAFNQILGSYPTDCTANWGMTLADVQDLTQNQLQTIVDFSNIETNLLGDNLGVFFAGISTDLTDITKRTPVIEQKACEFALPILPVSVLMDPTNLISSLNTFITGGLPPTDTALLSLLSLNYQVKFGSQWGPAEARVLGATSNTLLTFVNILSAHSLDASALISLFMGGSNPLSNLNLSDPIGLLRGLGGIFAIAPTLLAFNNQGTGPADIKAAGNELAAALTELKGLNASLQLDAGNQNKVIAYTSNNIDGVVEAGDTFTVGALYYTNSTWVNLVEYLTSTSTGILTVPASISAGMVPSAETLMQELINNLQTGSPNFVPTDVNPLLNAIGLAADEFVTNVIRLNPHAIFTNPVPLRTFLPTIATANGDAGQFQIETEVSSGDPYGLTSIGWYYTDTDSAHFTDGTNPIVADGISVPATASPFNIPLLGQTPPMIFYISFNDPTFHNSLSIDLSQMLGFCETSTTEGAGSISTNCPATTPLGFQTADNYRLDKVIAGGIYGLFTDSTTGLPYTSTNPIW